MNKKYTVFIFIILACSFYAYLSRSTPANLDEQVSMVIALGKFPPLAEQFQKPHTPKEYLALLNYTQYSRDSITPKNVFQSVINDNSNAAIYYFLLSALIKATGYNLWWPRLLSIALAGINLYWIFLLAGKFQNRVFFMWTTLFMTAVNPVFILNAILIRGYMLALLGCLMSIFFLIEMISEKTPGRRLLCYYFLSVMLAAGSHYYTFSVLAAEFVFIFWFWRKDWATKRKFLLGYGIMIMLVVGWFILSYPVSWNNLRYLLGNYRSIAKVNSGYQLTVSNLIRQWLNVSTYFFSFSTDNMGKVRILVKCITATLFVMVMAKLYITRFRQNDPLLFMLILLSTIFYTCQAVFEGQLISFLPKYLVFIIPMIILAINVVLSGYLTRYRNGKPYLKTDSAIFTDSVLPTSTSREPE